MARSMVAGRASRSRIPAPHKKIHERAKCIKCPSCHLPGAGGEPRTLVLSPVLVMTAPPPTSPHPLAGKTSFALGSLVVWATRLRRVNGPNFTWPLVLFSRSVPEAWLHKTGKLYEGKPLGKVTRTL